MVRSIFDTNGIPYLKMKSVDKCHESKLIRRWSCHTVLVKNQNKVEQSQSTIRLSKKIHVASPDCGEQAVFCGRGTVSARIMAQTSYKETGAREVQIPKETLPSPFPTSYLAPSFQNH